MLFPPVVSLDSDENRKLSSEINHCIENISTNLGRIRLRIDRLNNEFDNLQVLADDVAEKYEKTAARRGPQNIDRKTMLQAILDHNLCFEDVELFTRYVKCLFHNILKLLWESNQDFKCIDTIMELHKQRSKNSELSHTYNLIARRLHLTNSGKADSCVYQLNSFLEDFNHPIRRKLYYKLQATYKFVTEETPNSPALLTTKSINGEDHSVVKMRSKLELYNAEMCDYALKRVQGGVQNFLLSTSLKACVRAVRENKFSYEC
ncbi:uncharacterized protein LOC143465372 [Clavelina lepadiformis]|uniref:uncharacterized protein LOC143465372 n=1 Tax=Clavelina lepadiformis TaxID=159417 RepID=UPI00404311EA